MRGSDPSGGNKRRRSSGRLYTLLAAILALAAVAVAVVLALTFLNDGFLSGLLPGGEPTPTLLAEARLPSATPSSSATPRATATAVAGGGRLAVGTLPATSTPLSRRQSSAAVPFPTLQPTQTPTPQPTFPTRTPTPTYTPTPTHTPTPGPSPTPSNTPSPYLFTKSIDSPFPLENSAANAGCRWMGIAGEVLNVDGSHVSPGQYQVHIWESGIDSRVAVGSATVYAPSGFEQYLNDGPRAQQHNIQLETVSGTPVSDVYRIQTFANCNSNLIYFIFERNR